MRRFLLTPEVLHPVCQIVALQDLGVGLVLDHVIMTLCLLWIGDRVVVVVVVVVVVGGPGGAGGGSLCEAQLGSIGTKGRIRRNTDKNYVFYQNMNV